jgi:hypothetical protein
VTKERFEELAAAYGGDLARWPDDAREEAALFAAAEPALAREVLAREDRLDAALHALPRLTASPELVERIVVSAPAARRRPRWRAWLAPAGLGAALAASAAAGVLLGAQIGERSGVGTQVSASAVADLDISGLSEDV